MGWLWIVMLALGFAVVIAAEWPRIASIVGADARKARERERVKATLHVLPGGEREEFARSVQADLDALPTIDEPTPKR